MRKIVLPEPSAKRPVEYGFFDAEGNLLFKVSERHVISPANGMILKAMGSSFDHSTGKATVYYALADSPIRSYAEWEGEATKKKGAAE